MQKHYAGSIAGSLRRAVNADRTCDFTVSDIQSNGGTGARQALVTLDPPHTAGDITRYRLLLVPEGVKVTIDVYDADDHFAEPLSALSGR